MPSRITDVLSILIITAVMLSATGCSGDSRDREYMDFADSVSEVFFVIPAIIAPLGFITGTTGAFVMYPGNK